MYSYFIVDCLSLLQLTHIEKINCSQFFKESEWKRNEVSITEILISETPSSQWGLHKPGKLVPPTMVSDKSVTLPINGKSLHLSQLRTGGSMVARN